ncbi:hypothetical protein A2U01_0078681, partial [Trifolium medium]|nr:hypothetical protein [Trifolium medium]
MTGMTQSSSSASPIGTSNTMGNTQGNFNDFRSPPRVQLQFPSNLMYGMPTSLMAGLHTNTNVGFSPSTSRVENRPIPQAL